MLTTGNRFMLAVSIRLPQGQFRKYQRCFNEVVARRLITPQARTRSSNMAARALHSIFTLHLIVYLTFLSSAVSASIWTCSERAETTLKLAGLRTEYKENPLGIDSRKPRLSWQILSPARGVIQSAYQVRVAS